MLLRCSLAQEVRTGNSYDIIEDKLCRKEVYSSDQQLMSPLPREDVASSKSGTSSPLGNNSSPSMIKPSSPLNSSGFVKGYYSPERSLSTVKEEVPERSKDGTMNPPTPPSIQRESP